MSVTEYQVVSESSFQAFRLRINRLLEEGWQPQGGLTVISSVMVNDTTYYQAMVR